MSFETEYANIIKNTDMISAGIGPALVQRVVALPLIYSEDLPQNTRTKLARKSGVLVAETLAESTGYTASASSEITESSITCTAAKHVVVAKPTVETLRFTPLTPESVTNMMADALARDLDDEIIALFTGFSQSETAASVCTIDDILDAAYQIEDEEAEPVGVNLRAILDKKQANEIRKEVKNSTAANFAVPTQLTLLGVRNTANGYIGSVPGVDCFTRTTTENGGYKIGLVFNPLIAFFSMYDTQAQFNSQFQGEGGFYLELSAYLFAKVVEWYDVAGCQVRSAT